MQKIEGVVVPVAVPIESNESIDREGLKRLVNFLIGSEVNGLFANGSMGAFALLPDHTQFRAIQLVAEFGKKRLPVLAGASDTSTSRVLQKVREIQQMDVDAIVLLPPFYYAYTQRELQRFFFTVADFAQKPLMLYENPKLVPNSLSVDTIAKLAEHPNICGIKFSSPDVSRWQDLIRTSLPRERFSMISGAGRMTGLALQLGFDGITEGLHNIVPNLAIELLRAAKQREFDVVDRIQQKINRCFRILDTEGGWRGLELAFQYMGIAERAAIHPFDFVVEGENRQTILKALREESILRPYPSLLPAASLAAA